MPETTEKGSDVATQEEIDGMIDNLNDQMNYPIHRELSDLPHEVPFLV